MGRLLPWSPLGGRAGSVCHCAPGVGLMFEDGRKGRDPIGDVGGHSARSTESLSPSRRRRRAGASVDGVPGELVRRRGPVPLGSSRNG